MLSCPVAFMIDGLSPHCKQSNRGLSGLADLRADPAVVAVGLNRHHVCGSNRGHVDAVQVDCVCVLAGQIPPPEVALEHSADQ
jgi:hypothetical protein